MTYSGPIKRLLAFTVDVFVVIGIYMVFAFFLGISFFSTPLLSLPMIGFWFYGGMFLLTWLYFAGFESSKHQATIGKKLFRIKVTDLKGKRIGFFRASVRYFSKILSRVLLMIGFLMIPFTKKKQGLHDKIAKTVVIRF